MAQAPPEQACPNPNRKQDTKTCFSITDCPICLESLRKPKSLPCLHTFCQECLSINITGTEIPGTVLTCFECPVCRRRTLPPQPNSPSDKWASQFPTNGFVIEMMKTLKPVEESPPQICHPCSDRKNENVTAICWCQDCGFFLCESCHQSHSVVLYRHKVFSLDELSQHPMVLIPYAQNLCAEHNEKLNLICVSHDTLVCHTCIAIEHRRCDEVTTVSKYAETLKSKGTFYFNDVMDKHLKDIDGVISQIRTKLDIIAQDKYKALQLLSDAKRRFDDKTSKLTDEVIKTYKDETGKMKKGLDSIEAVRTSMLQTKAMKETAQDENQLVTTVMRGKSEMSRCDEIFKNQDNETVRINLKFKDEFGIFLNNDDNIGTVNVFSRSIKPMFGRKASPIGTISVPCTKNLTGMLVLPNQAFIVSDRDGKQLLLQKETGELIGKTSLDGKPWDLCLMPNGDIAAAVNDVDKISILRVSSSKLSLVRDIPLKVRPDSVTFYNGGLHISSECTFLRVSDDGSTTQLQTLPKLSYSITTRKDGQLIGGLEETDPCKTAVYKVSPENVYSEVIKAYLVKDARGVAVDDEDNIYVCGKTSNNIVQISADGSSTAEIITSNDISNPYMVQFSREKLYVSQYTGKIVKIFKLE